MKSSKKRQRKCLPWAQMKPLRQQWLEMSYDMVLFCLKNDMVKPQFVWQAELSFTALAAEYAKTQELLMPRKILRKQCNTLYAIQKKMNP